MIQNPFISIALVGYLTNDVREYINHLNIDTRISNPLHLNDEKGAEFLPMFIEYMHRDSSIRTSTKVLFDNHNNDIVAVTQDLTDSLAIEEIIRSYNNFYLDYVNSIKFIAQGSYMLVPYPLAGTRNMDFDYYIILEQDETQTFAEYSNESIFFEMYKKRMQEVLPQIPQDKMVKATIPYNPYEESNTVSRLLIINYISSFCANFFEENYKRLSSLEIASNPQSSNSTL